jgi:hypothetical protein
MLLHYEYLWLIAYLIVLAGAVAAAVVAGAGLLVAAAIAVVGLPVVFFGWTWQVGRFG